jgi:L-ascorbate metabolism protein UlaG (beta-lactamase superfamily)
VTAVRITYIGGPTALLELGGLRLLTDPTFDPAGTVYPTGASTLCKTVGPARPPEALTPVDAVLLSHDHHFDNLDHSGRAMLRDAPRVLTTVAGAARLGGGTFGLDPWQEMDLPAPDGRVRATDRHAPIGGRSSGSSWPSWTIRARRSTSPATPSGMKEFRK